MAIPNPNDPTQTLLSFGVLFIFAGFLFLFHDATVGGSILISGSILTGSHYLAEATSKSIE